MFNPRNNNSRRALYRAALETLESRQLMSASLNVGDSSGDSADRAVAFADTDLNVNAVTQVFTVGNTGDSDLDVTDFLVGGTNASDFTVNVTDNGGSAVNADNFVIAAGDTFTVSVVFKPTAAGARSASIGFSTNDATTGNDAVTLAASGNGLTPATIVVSDDSGSSSDKSITFAGTSLGRTSATSTFTITNTGDDTLTITDIALAGDNPDDFALTVKDQDGDAVDIGSSFDIPAGVAYTVEVEFAPQAEGSRSALVTFDTNDTSSPSVTLSVDGTGTPQVIPDAPTALTTTASVTQITLNWTDNADNEDGYHVYQSTTVNGTYSLVGNIDSDSDTFTQSSLVPGHHYFYKIASFNDAGESTLVAADATTASYTDYAPNTVKTARNLGTVSGNRSVHEYVGDADLSDFYRVTMATSGTLRVVLNGLSADADLALYKLNANGSVTALGTSERAGTTADGITKNVAAGSYIVKTLRGDVGENTDYILTVNTDYALNTTGSARALGTLTKARSFNDFVGALDGDDYYRFSLDRTRKLSLTLGGLGNDIDLELLDSKGHLVKASENNGTTAEAISRSLVKGTYFIHVVKYADSNYKLTASAV